MLCPRCDQQGTVYRVRINATGEVVHLCEECEALWPAGTAISGQGFVDFPTYVKQFGLKGLWNEITLLEAYEPEA